MNYPLLAIIGPTGSGKSSLAITLARAQQAEILSVDSMQIYNGMDIGTAKPSLAEQHEIVHHLINWVRPDETFSVARFVEIADKVIKDAARRSCNLIAVGGTPLYYKALFFGLFDGPSADTGVRDALAEQSDAALHERVSQIDPISAGRIHPADRKRLIRAIEVHTLTGKPISSFQTDWDAQTLPRHDAIWIGLRWDREALNRRINARVRDMIDAGWLDEVRDLRRQYPNLSNTASQATGYGTLLNHLAGRMSLPDAIEQIKIATRQLARKQMKWLKRFPNVYWLEGDQPLDKLTEQTLEIWHAAGQMRQAGQSDPAHQHRLSMSLPV